MDLNFLSFKISLIPLTFFFELMYKDSFFDITKILSTSFRIVFFLSLTTVELFELL